MLTTEKLTLHLSGPNRRFIARRAAARFRTLASRWPVDRQFDADMAARCVAACCRDEIGEDWSRFDAVEFSVCVGEAQRYHRELIELGVIDERGLPARNGERDAALLPHDH